MIYDFTTNHLQHLQQEPLMDKPDFSNLSRPIQPMPDFVKTALLARRAA